MKVFKQNTQVDGLMDNNLIQKNLLKTLKPILEDWCKKELANDISIYGIRRYLRGAWLSLHVDKLPTHIVSAILQVSTYLINTLFKIQNSNLIEKQYA